MKIETVYRPRGSFLKWKRPVTSANPVAEKGVAVPNNVTRPPNAGTS
jgi:hypothetical protein